MSKLPEGMLGRVIFSPDQVYRYELRRKWGFGEGACAFIMLNPSTATAEENDPTIRRCIGFAQEWGFGELIVGNIYALRSTDPKGLMTHPAPIGPENDDYLDRIVGEAGLAVAAWGAFPFAAERGKEVLKLFPDLHCLGTTAKGAPKHPLYLRKDLTPVEISPEERR